MYPCRADSSTTTHAATAASAAAAAVMESSGYSYGGYSFNNSPSSQGLFTSFPSPVLNRRLAAAVGVAAGVSGGGDSDHRGGVNRMDPQLTCLKLGKRQHLEKSSAVKPYSGGSDDLGASAATAAKCQVDGCQAALVRAKEYHRRHKVCEVHAKAAVVVLGVNQRFCQQCSRFHLVSEFDESKRSCRSRLAGHNKRRRKSSIAAASTWRAPSLLSSTTNTNAPAIVLPSDLSSRSSAALRELIDEHRATTFLAGSHHIQRQVTLDLMQQGPRLVTKARDEEPCFGLWNSFL